MFMDQFVKCKGRIIAAVVLTAEEIHEFGRDSSAGTCRSNVSRS